MSSVPHVRVGSGALTSCTVYGGCADDGGGHEVDELHGMRDTTDPNSGGRDSRTARASR